MQYSIWQLLGFTALAAVVFWFVRQFGFAATMMVAGVGANYVVVSVLDLRSLFSGAVWGGAVHGVVLFVLCVFGAIEDGLLGTVVYVLPGAYMGSFLAAWRQASDIAAIDAPMGPMQKGEGEE